ncbi:MAG: hypothetical protein ABL907_08605, partial [Hyphomicrobium sp.]
WVLLVEGQSDAIALRALFADASEVLRRSLTNHHFVIDHLNGATKLSYKLTELQNALCGVHVFLDHDDAGRTAGEAAITDGLLKPIDCHYTTCSGKKNSEWEDLINPDIYAEYVLANYGVELKGPAFQNSKIWHDRMAETFLRAGKTWNERTKTDLKTFVAKAVAASPTSALNAHQRGSFDNLITALEQKAATRRDTP